MPLSCNLGTLTSWNTLGHSRPITGLFYLYLDAILNISGLTFLPEEDMHTEATERSQRVVGMKML
jgi:hypothetical protein